MDLRVELTLGATIRMSFLLLWKAEEWGDLIPGELGCREIVLEEGEREEELVSEKESCLERDSV